MRTQPDDFLINSFYLAEGEEVEQMLVAHQYDHRAAVAGLRDNLRGFLTYISSWITLDAYSEVWRTH